MIFDWSIEGQHTDNERVKIKIILEAGNGSHTALKVAHRDSLYQKWLLQRYYVLKDFFFKWRRDISTRNKNFGPKLLD